MTFKLHFPGNLCRAVFAILAMFLLFTCKFPTNVCLFVIFECWHICHTLPTSEFPSFQPRSRLLLLHPRQVSRLFVQVPVSPLWVINTLLIFCFFLSRTLRGVPAYKKKEKAHCERCRHTFLRWRGHHNTHTKEHTLPISSFVIKARKKEGCWQMLIAPASRQWRGKPRPAKCLRDQKWLRANSVHTWHDHCSIALLADFFLNRSDQILHNNIITDNLWRDLQLPWLKSSTSVESRSTCPSLPPVTINIWEDYHIYFPPVGNPDHTWYLSQISHPLAVQKF